MNDFEKQLKDIHLDAPSPQLDRRMQELFTIGPARPSSVRWWWMALPAAGAVAASLLLMSHQPERPPQPQTLVYRVEAQGAMREWLLELPVESQTPPRMIVSFGP